MSRRREVGARARQTPYRRAYPDGRVVWVARYRDLEGRRRYAKPRWNGGASTFDRKGDAQRAIDEALDQLHGRSEAGPASVGEYFEQWLKLHPRSPRTNKTHADRISYGLDVEIEARALREWRFDELRRRHVLVLLDHLLRVDGRAAQGARGILSAFSAMAEDAIGDDRAEANAFRGLRLRHNDPRVRRPARRPRIWRLEQMREFAAAGRAEVRARTPRPRDRRSRKGAQRFFSAHDYEALLLTPALTGLRLGEFLALRRADYAEGLLSFRYSAHEGELVESSAQKNHERSVPVPPSLAKLIEPLLGGEGTQPLFATPTGLIWRERNFYRDVWEPARIASGLDPTPHEFRHSYVSHLRAAGIDDADLALVAGHRVETMISIYTHPLRRSHDAIRASLG